ncbi:MAG: CHRD domain-containing protein [Planctomycetota bacterium]
MKRLSLFTALGLLLAQLAGAQTLFRATLEGSNEVPPVITTASAWATFVLNPDNTVTYLVNAQGLVGVAAHIHEGDPGVSGPIIFPLSGGPDIYSGTTVALDATQIGKLRGRHYYVNVHTSAPTPTARCAVRSSRARSAYGAHLIGAEETPPVTTNALGDATFSVNADNTITYFVTTAGLTESELTFTPAPWARAERSCSRCRAARRSGPEPRRRWRTSTSTICRRWGCT